MFLGECDVVWGEVVGMVVIVLGIVFFLVLDVLIVIELFNLDTGELGKKFIVIFFIGVFGGSGRGV